MMVASMVATTFSSEPVMVNASAAQTVNVLPALFTCALATSASPAAGDNKFTFNSTVSTSLSSAVSDKAAYPQAESRTEMTAPACQ